jgi:acetyl esterase/lipase/2-keto-4-pentenoate hydratase
MKNLRALLCLGATGSFLAIGTASSFAAPPAAVLPNVTLVPSEMILLWPNGAPDETAARGPEHVIPDRPRPFDQIADVTEPTLAVCLPAKEKRNGTAMLVIPGGGLERLAIEHEGYEVAEWLNEQGISAFILKYRVPPRDPKVRWKVGVQDAQRAMGIIRSRAKDWAIDANAIGSIGFSAGAEINIVLSVRGADRQYSRVDAADDVSPRPDFNVAIYGGGFADVKANELRPDIASRINAETPPMFIAHAFDDQALSSVILMNALKRAGVVSELHIFGAGAHGFGVRDSGLPVAAWRELCLHWLAWQGFMDSAAVRAYAAEFSRAWTENAAAYPRFTVTDPSASLAEAYAVQRRVVGARMRGGDQIVGYVAAVMPTAAQTSSEDGEGLHGVLLKSGRIDAGKPVTVRVDAQRPGLIGTGIGYVIAVDIGSKLRVPRQAATSVEAIVPVIELPRVLNGAGPNATPQDQMAVNLGADRFLVGDPVSPPAGEIGAAAIELMRDGNVLQVPRETGTKEAHALSLMRMINQIIEEGRVLHRGDVIIFGTRVATTAATSGNYVADYGRWGKIEFRLE